MSDPQDRRARLETAGDEVHSALEGLGWKLEEALQHLDVKGGPEVLDKEMGHAEGTYRLVAAELEQLAETLRSAVEADET